MTEKNQDKGSSKGNQGQRQQRKPWHHRKQHHRPEYKKKEKDPEEIPILKYGPANNFTKFKEAISKTALKDYGQLGKLIKLGKYYEPEEPDSTEYDMVNDPMGINMANYREDMKEYRKELMRMRNERPKLYALILQYLSDESLEEIKRSDKFEAIDEATDPLGLWLLVEETHKVNTISKVEAMTRLAARSTYQTMRQGPFESIITYKERFNAALKGYKDQKNPDMDEKDIGMDFFKGLDDNRYATFKTDLTNQLTLKSIEQPENLNAMYLLANQWLTTKTKNPTGTATTFTTTCDRQEPRKPNRNNNKNKRDKKNNEKQEKSESDEKQVEKKEKDLSHIECFACGENGHYANACPTRSNKQDEEERGAHLTWNANTFATYQVLNVSQEGSFNCRKPVLLDNQANISIFHPDMLRDLKDAGEEIKVNGVGGHQFTVTKTGYLDPLFRVYASDHTHANILSLAEVEERFLVTYAPQENFIVHLPMTDIVFNRINGMYVADWEQVKTAYATSGTEAYIRRQKKRAPSKHTNYYVLVDTPLLERLYTLYRMGTLWICPISL
mmetsp:Transcript_8146/g.11879  ORF Transcript_8146/g.11879 Transcript_8146/m.11879 type:complete len:557 (+) Transcript_8146:2397-4067(+)